MWLDKHGCMHAGKKSEVYSEGSLLICLLIHEEFFVYYPTHIPRRKAYQLAS